MALRSSFGFISITARSLSNLDSALWPLQPKNSNVVRSICCFRLAKQRSSGFRSHPRRQVHTESGDLPSKVSVSRYLLTRLYQLGVRSIHGVPAGLSLRVLEDFAPAGVKFIGNCNELNATYAAEGYARVKGISALFTSFGVGELSAVNGVASAYADHSPLVHIVATPSTQEQNSGAIVQHSLGDGNLRIFADIHAKITVAQVNLNCPDTVPEMCDWVLQQCVRHRRPVYIELPSDMQSRQVSASNLSHPLDVAPPLNNQDHEDAAIDLVLQRMYSSQKPMILTDGLAAGYDIDQELNQLVRETGFPTMSVPYGNGIIDHTSHENYHGVHAGKFGKLNHTAYAKSSDLTLLFGPLLSGNNTIAFGGGPDVVPDQKTTITFRGSSIEIGSATFDLQIKSFIRKLLSQLNTSKFSFTPPSPPLGTLQALIQALPPTIPNGPIDQDTFWLRLSSFFRPGDHILTANGTPWIGSRDFLLPPQTTLIQSGIWLSVGQMLPAAQGVALAQRDGLPDGKKTGRTILLEGDGSFQMTCQELSTIIRQRLDVTIFIFNNGGYTFERLIHGMDEEYNEIAPWRYLEAPSFFGAPKGEAYEVETRMASNWAEMEAVLQSKSFGNGRGLKLVEVKMAKDDFLTEFKPLLVAAGEQLLDDIERR